MSQSILDPNDVGNPVQTISINVLPPRTRRFGYVPDLSACKAGDLILFRDAAPGWLSKSIARAQGLAGFSDEHSCWTHAAVFLYEDFIVEADLWPGIRARSLYSDIPGSILRVRRCPVLSDDQRYLIALSALRMLGARYGKLAALKLGWRMTHGLWDRAGSLSFGPVVICSKVYFDAHASITRTALNGCPFDAPVTPAHLSATSDLDDVSIGWRRLT